MVKFQESFKAGMGRGDSGSFNGSSEFCDFVIGVVIAHREFLAWGVAGGIVDLGRGAEVGEAIGNGFREA